MNVLFTNGNPENCKKLFDTIQGKLDNISFYSYASIEEVLIECKKLGVYPDRVIITDNFLQSVNKVSLLNDFIKWVGNSCTMLLITKNPDSDITKEYLRVFDSPNFTCIPSNKLSPNTLINFCTNSINEIAINYNGLYLSEDNIVKQVESKSLTEKVTSQQSSKVGTQNTPIGSPKKPAKKGLFKSLFGKTEKSAEIPQGNMPLPTPTVNPPLDGVSVASEVVENVIVTGVNSTRLDGVSPNNSMVGTLVEDQKSTNNESSPVYSDADNLTSNNSEDFGDDDLSLGAYGESHSDTGVLEDEDELLVKKRIQEEEVRKKAELEAQRLKEEEENRLRIQKAREEREERIRLSKEREEQERLERERLELEEKERLEREELERLALESLNDEDSMKESENVSIGIDNLNTLDAFDEVAVTEVSETISNQNLSNQGSDSLYDNQKLSSKCSIDSLELVKGAKLEKVNTPLNLSSSALDIKFSNNEKIVFVTGLTGSGVSSSIIKTAESYTSEGERVLVIDCDLKHGLLSHLNSVAFYNDCCYNGLKDLIFYKENDVSYLSDGFGESLKVDKVRKLLKDDNFTSRFDRIFIDCPLDSLIWVSHIDLISAGSIIVLCNGSVSSLETTSMYLTDRNILTRDAEYYINYNSITVLRDKSNVEKVKERLLFPNGSWLEKVV